MHASVIAFPLVSSVSLDWAFLRDRRRRSLKLASSVNGNNRDCSGTSVGLEGKCDRASVDRGSSRFRLKLFRKPFQPIAPIADRTYRTYRSSLRSKAWVLCKRIQSLADLLCGLHGGIVDTGKCCLHGFEAVHVSVGQDVRRRKDFCELQQLAHKLFRASATPASPRCDLAKGQCSQTPVVLVVRLLLKYLAQRAGLAREELTHLSPEAESDLLEDGKLVQACMKSNGRVPVVFVAGCFKGSDGTLASHGAPDRELNGLETT